MIHRGPRFGWPVLEGCGITEIGGYYAAQPLDPLDREGKAGAMGRPTKGTQVRLVEDGWVRLDARFRNGGFVYIPLCENADGLLQLGGPV